VKLAALLALAGSFLLGTTPAHGPLSGKTIAIDPGHNGKNWAHPSEINRQVNAGTLYKPCDTTGTETNAGYTEAAYTFDVALRLRAVLEAAGAKVVLTRTSNDGWGPCITERAAIGNRAHADAAISIHADGGPSSGRGFHVIYPPSIHGLTDDIAAASKSLALDVRDAFHAGTGMPYATYIGSQALDVRSDLGGLNLSDVPKVFIETGNMRNATDAALLSSPAFRAREAAGLAAGLSAFLVGPAAKPTAAEVRAMLRAIPRGRRLCYSQNVWISTTDRHYGEIVVQVSCGGSIYEHYWLRRALLSPSAAWKIVDEINGTIDHPAGCTSKPVPSDIRCH
jgi:N-acetylmuramoyl-L-alanine amidase